MAGIYIHIPFCRNACHYCNFHFSTTLHHKLTLCEAITKEIILRKQELNGQSIETVYFGGGTPSILNESELNLILTALESNFNLSEVKEFTLEANPDDLTESYLKYLKTTPINRLSIGVQSFLPQDLVWMNRAHTVSQATNSLQLAKAVGFESFNLDLMYGLPNLTAQDWINNIETALSFEPTHISAYCLTVEPKTAMAHSIEAGKISPIAEEIAEEQFHILRQILRKAGYVHYEISNFSKPQKMALHNTNYWRGKHYLGIGPAAHSYNGKQRSWNFANNQKYMQLINSNALALSFEDLTEANQFNEFVMTSLRTMWGINLSMLNNKFGSNRSQQLLKEAQVYIQIGKLKLEEDHLKLSPEALFFADGIAADLFQLN